MNEKSSSMQFNCCTWFDNKVPLISCFLTFLCLTDWFDLAEQFLNEEPEAVTRVQISCSSPIKNAFKSMTVRPAKRVEFNSSQSSLSSMHRKLLKDGIKQGRVLLFPKLSHLICVTTQLHSFDFAICC